MAVKRKLKTVGKRGIRRLFEMGQRAGVNILPHHFYSETPDIAELKRDARWKRARTMKGVNGTGIEEQLGFVREIMTGDSSLADDELYRVACERNGEAGFGPVEASFLHAFVRKVKPRRIVQVGCGVSTAVVIHAAEQSGYRPSIACVEPFPTDFLRQMAAQGEIELVVEKAQHVAQSVLTELGTDGFLFVDSTHTVTPGSEVNRIILDVLPELAPGSWVHFHDITFPYDYLRGMLTSELFFHRESALLHAFLIGNAHYAIQASFSMLHYERKDELRQLFTSYRPSGDDDHGLERTPGSFPSSLYLRASS